MEKPIISVIVPVYNVENYIERSIKSVVNQKPFSENKVEIIIVDDGSTDSSPKICDRLSKEYAMINVVHKKNGGVANARNEGIKLAGGRYIQFLDPDDELEPEVCEAIISSLKNEPDVLICRYNETDTKTGIKTECNYTLNENAVSSLSHGALLEELISGRLYQWYSWLYVINSDFLKRNNLYFKNLRCCEDAVWVPEVLYKAKKADYLSLPVYNYYINRSESLTKKTDEKTYNDKIKAISLIFNFCKENNFSNELTCKMMGNLSPVYMALLADNRLYGKDKSNKYLQEIKKFDICLKYSVQADKRYLYKLRKIIGIKAMVYLLFARKKLICK